MCKRTDNQTCNQAQSDCCVHGTGTLAGFGKVNKRRSKYQKDQENDFDDRQDTALAKGKLVGSLQGVAFVQEKDTAENADNKARQTEDRI